MGHTIFILYSLFFILYSLLFSSAPLFDGGSITTDLPERERGWVGLGGGRKKGNGWYVRGCLMGEWVVLRTLSMG